jgi:hypothetical protein
MCEDFAVHARNTVTFGGTASAIHGGGDVGVSPGVSITEVATTEFPEGGVFLENESKDFSAGVTSRHALAVTYQAAAQTMIPEMGSKTFTPGIYRAATSINIAANLEVTLDGDNQDHPIFIFQAGTTLTTGANTKIKLINGATADNILWAIGTAVTLGANSYIEGSMTTGTAVTMGGLSVVNGCVLAQSAITFPSKADVFYTVPSGRRALVSAKENYVELLTAGGPSPCCHSGPCYSCHSGSCYSCYPWAHLPPKSRAGRQRDMYKCWWNFRCPL